MAMIERQKRGSTEGMSVREEIDFNVAAFHDSPVKAREKIREAAARCLLKIDTVERFWMESPYVYE